MFVFILESSVILVIFTVFIEIAFVFMLSVLVCVMSLLFCLFLLVLGFISNIFFISNLVLVILVLELSFFSVSHKDNISLSFFKFFF